MVVRPSRRTEGCNEDAFCSFPLGRWRGACHEGEAQIDGGEAMAYPYLARQMSDVGFRQNP